MTRTIGMITLMSLLLLGMSACQGIRMKGRHDVEGAPGLTVSQYKPESSEGCEVVGQKTCDYMAMSFDTVQEVCSKKVSSEATSLGANYIWVNEPKQSVGGFATRSPVANFYKCDALKPR